MNILNVLIKKFKKVSRKAFILPFTMLICVLILLVTSTSMTLLSKQLYFSKLYKQSQSAYYAADDALACAINIDDTYQGVDGLGIFPSDNNKDTDVYMKEAVTYVNEKRLAIDPSATDPITLDTIMCGQSYIFKTGPISDPDAYSQFATTTFERNYGGPTPETGVSSTYFMRMDLGGGVKRCATVTVNKTQSYRQVISQGYSHCDNINTSVERAVVSTTRF